MTPHPVSNPDRHPTGASPCNGRGLKQTQELMLPTLAIRHQLPPPGQSGFSYPVFQPNSLSAATVVSFGALPDTLYHEGGSQPIINPYWHLTISGTLRMWHSRPGAWLSQDLSGVMHLTFFAFLSSLYLHVTYLLPPSSRLRSRHSGIRQDKPNKIQLRPNTGHR